MKYKHVSYGLGFRVDRSSLPKTYGWYTRNGKRRLRNYHRELKNGMGLSFTEVLVEKFKQNYENLPIHFKPLFKKRLTYE